MWLQIHDFRMKQNVAHSFSILMPCLCLGYQVTICRNGDHWTCHNSLVEYPLSGFDTWISAPFFPEYSSSVSFVWILWEFVELYQSADIIVARWNSCGYRSIIEVSNLDLDFIMFNCSIESRDLILPATNGLAQSLFTIERYYPRLLLALFSLRYTFSEYIYYIMAANLVHHCLSSRLRGACEECRRRKLKCDGREPCRSCAKTAT
jgi:hypothetical protein